MDKEEADMSKDITLDDIYVIVSTMKDSREMTDKLVAELKHKVGDHDLAIVTMAKAVEDMNKTFSSMAETFKESRSDLSKFQKETAEFQKQYQIEQVKHWSTQDGIMKEIRQVLDGMSKYERKFEQVESRQLNGCPAFLGFKERRESDLRHWEDVKTTLLASTAKSHSDIEELTKSVAVLVEQVTVANKRIADLEEFEEDFGTWKDGMYKGLIANGIALIGAIGLAIWNVFTKS